MWFYVIAGLMIFALLVLFVALNVHFAPEPDEGQGPE